jgi:hypothetical protein
VILFYSTTVSLDCTVVGFIDVIDVSRSLLGNFMKILLLLLTFAMAAPALAETAVERECASGKCTCTHIASTCKAWNRTHGGDLAICDSYRQTCMSTGRWDDRNRHIDVVVKR